MPLTGSLQLSGTQLASPLFPLPKARDMHVILHVGAHRTATTTLQQHLARHRMRLAQDGVIYWGPRVARGGLFRGATAGRLPPMPWRAGRVAGRCKMRAAAIEQTGAETLLISDENMLGSLRSCLEDAQLYRDAGARVSAFAKGFADHRLTIALSVRTYADWWSSAMAFRLGRAGPLPRDALRERMVTQPRRWRYVIEEIARTLPDANVAVWTHEQMAGAPQRVVAALTGQNTFAGAVRVSNPRPTGPELRGVLADAGVDLAAHPALAADDFMPFHPHEVEAFSEQYQEDLDWLRDGAAGFADYLDAPLERAPTEQGRGSDHDREARRMA